MTKKNNEVPEIEKTLAKRQELKDRISAIISSLGRSVNVEQLGIASGEANTRESSFLNSHGRGNESNIPEHKMSEFVALKNAAEKKRNAYVEAKQKDDALRNELAVLKAELEALGRQATAEEVKKYQNEAAAIEKHIEALKQAVMKEADTAAQSNSSSEALNNLHREREDLMADVALGATNNKPRLDEIETQITKEAARISAAKDVADSSKIIIAGLQRKISVAEQSLSHVKEIMQSVYCDFLISEANKEGAEFIALSDKLWAQVTRLITLNTMIERHPAAAGAWTLPGELRSFKIPSFVLRDGPPGIQLKGFYNLSNPLDINTEVDAIKHDFSALGIK